MTVIWVLICFPKDFDYFKILVFFICLGAFYWPLKGPLHLLAFKSILISAILIIYTSTDTFQQIKTSVLVEISSSNPGLFYIRFKLKYCKEHLKL